jgi:hypothetical protein
MLHVTMGSFRGGRPAVWTMVGDLLALIVTATLRNAA